MATQPMTRKLAAFFNGASILSFLILVPLITQAQQKPLGTDISDFQGTNNWKSMTNAGVVFCWAKATEGTYFTATSFVSHVIEAKAYGVPIGAYHYARPSDDPGTAGADTEAKFFWGVASNYVKSGGGYLVPMLDWEDPYATNANDYGFTSNTMSAWVNEWCNDISNDAALQGMTIRPVVYTGTWYSIPTSGASGYPGLSPAVTNWPNWMSDYSGAPAQSGAPTTSPWPSWAIWQYADTNWSGGDADVYNGNLENFLRTFEIGGTNAPYFVTTPTNIIVNSGTNITLSSKVSGLSPSFQWSKNGSVIPGATSSNYTFTAVQVANAGDYTVTAGNSYGIIPSKMILSVLGYLTNSPSAVLAPTNMVNWWTGNGNGYDIYGVTNAGPFGNLSYTNAKVGMGFRFDGSTAFLSNNAPEIAPPWTVCAWVYRQNSPQSAASLLGDQTYAIKIQQYGETSDLGVSHSGVCDFYVPVGLTVNAWSHLAITYNGSQFAFYTNGTLASSQLYSNNVSVPTPSGFELPRAYIGADWFTTVAGDYDDFMLGAVNELQIFTNALSASQIQSIYNAGSAGLVRAPQFTSVTNLNNSQVQLNLIGQTGKAITLSSSTNVLLNNWTSLGAIPNPTGATNYTSSTSASPQKFYRAAQQY